jgi:hypothetical protein
MQPADTDLDPIFDGATSYEIVEGGPDASTAPRHILVESGSPDHLVKLRDALRITGEGGHCMCGGDATLRVKGPDGVRATIGLHHGTSIRWPARWQRDALLASPETLAALLASQGWPLYRQQLAEGEQRAGDADAARARWGAAMPEPLRRLEAELVNESGMTQKERLAQARSVLVDALGSDDAAMLALLGWYGAGAGPWSGYPFYESVASDLLLAFPTKALLRVLDRPLSNEQLAGAARFASGWAFRRERKKVPRTIVERLRVHVAAHGTADQREAFVGVFGRSSSPPRG